MYFAVEEENAGFFFFTILSQKSLFKCDIKPRSYKSEDV